MFCATECCPISINPIINSTHHGAETYIPVMVVIPLCLLFLYMWLCNNNWALSLLFVRVLQHIPAYHIPAANPRAPSLGSPTDVFWTTCGGLSQRFLELIAQIPRLCKVHALPFHADPSCYLYMDCNFAKSLAFRHCPLMPFSGTSTMKELNCIWWGCRTPLPHPSLGVLASCSSAMHTQALSTQDGYVYTSKHTSPKVRSLIPRPTGLDWLCPYCSFFSASKMGCPLPNCPLWTDPGTGQPVLWSCSAGY